MQIVDLRRKPPVGPTLREMPAGSCYYHNGTLYMKTDEATGINGRTYRVVCLASGKADRMGPDVQVTPVITKLEVRDIE